MPAAGLTVSYKASSTRKVINKPSGKMRASVSWKRATYILTNDFFKPRKFELMIPNPLNDWGKILLEKDMLRKNRRRYAYLP